MTYHTLNAITDDASEFSHPFLSVLAWLTMTAFPQAFIVSPYDASTPPYNAELSARFPEWTEEEVDQLMVDHETEIATLKGYIDEAGLERLVKECAELVKRDRTIGVDGDVEM